MVNLGNPSRAAFVIPLDIITQASYISTLSTLKSEVTDVYVVLTRQSDKYIWEKIKGSSQCEALVLSNWCSEEAIRAAEDNNSMTTFKKWMALYLMMTIGKQSYDYLITCESEVQALRPLDKDFIASLPSQLTFVGDHADTPEKTKTLEEVNKCQGTTPYFYCHNTLYTWWTGMPVYVTTGLDFFLRFVGCDNPLTLATSLSPAVLDHLVYQRYLVNNSLHGARYVCLSHDLKGSGLSPQEAAKRVGLDILWVSRVDRVRNPKSGEGAYVEYHIDRTVYSLHHPS